MCIYIYIYRARGVWNHGFVKRTYHKFKISFMFQTSVKRSTPNFCTPSQDNL